MGSARAENPSRAIRKQKKLKIWSAACSTGEEPYTIAMMLSNLVPLSQIEILATDLDENVMARAELGIYPERSLTEVPEEIKRKYFEKEGSFYRVNDEIKKVTFKSKIFLRISSIQVRFSRLPQCFNLFH